MGINKLWTWVCTYNLVQSCWLFQPCNCSQDIRTEAAEPLTSAAYIRAWTRPVTGACKYQQSLEQGSVIQLVLIVITTHKKLVYSTTGRHNVNHKQICIDSFGLGTWSSSPSTYANTKNLNTVLCNKKQRLKAPVVVNKGSVYKQMAISHQWTLGLGLSCLLRCLLITCMYWPMRSEISEPCNR